MNEKAAFRHRNQQWRLQFEIAPLAHFLAVKAAHLTGGRQNQHPEHYNFFILT